VGAQVGLVNISREMYGVPFGLANFVEEGIHDASIWWENEDRTWVGVQNGSNIFYTLAYAGFARDGAWRELEGFAVGFGLGFRVESRPFYLDIDAGWKRVTDGSEAQDRFAALFDPARGASFPSARIIMAGVTIGGGLGWFMGGAFDVAGPLSHDTIGYFDGDERAIGLADGVMVYPKFFTGFKL